jgi:ABC-2 type transport system ATP-binding protein
MSVADDAKIPNLSARGAAVQPRETPRPAPGGTDAPVIVSVQNLSKTYATGVQALKPINLDIRRGEIFALLGPNGAGKTTLISIICGIVTPSSGTVVADGHDILADYRHARTKIGLVPQELTTDRFETVLATTNFSRGLFGRPANRAYVEKVLRDLTLWDKRKDQLQTLSGGMKRRVMIAKALSHEPTILFLDEPTAGVDVELRRDMWNLVRRLRDNGVTIILTTHYIGEAEEMADRIGVINKGELILVEEKTKLIKKLGKKQLTLHLAEQMTAVPAELAEWNLTLKADGHELEYVFDANAERTGVPSLLRRMADIGIAFKDLNTTQSSLEDIFVSLVSERKK